ncbi:MAG: hypothetical protein NTAFB09_07870 [Nitrosospira sp.]
MISLVYDKTIGVFQYGAGSVLNLAPSVEANLVQAGSAKIVPLIRPILQSGVRCHSDAVGTWSLAGSVITISRTAHGALTGDKYAFSPTAGTGTTPAAGIYAVTGTPDANTLTLSADASTTGTAGTGTMTGIGAQTLFSGTVPGGSMGKNGSLRIMCRHRHANSANTKTFEVFFGGVKFTQYGATTTLSSGVMAWIQNTNSDQLQQLSTSPGSGVVVGAGSYNATGADWKTANIDTSVDQQLVLKCTKVNGAEFASLENIIVELIPSLD